MSKPLWRMSACDLAEGIQTRAFSSREVVASCLQRADETNGKVNALTEIRAEAALAAADAADQAVARGETLGCLHGIPVTIKGNVDLAGWATVNGSALLKENVARETSPCVQNWLNAGAVIIGRTNTPEFSCRWETNNEVYGPTRNPFNPQLTAGGSSGGAAASLAVGMTPLAHGTDLGGSLRQPAQACGVASIRPSLGRVPDYVPTEHEPSIGIQLMNTDGPMARRVADVRLGLKAMAVGDWRGPWWVPAPWDQPTRRATQRATQRDVPIALIVDPLGQGVDQQVASGVELAAGLLVDAGYGVEQAEPATLADAVRVWKMIVMGELFTGLEPAVTGSCSPSLARMFAHYHLAVPDWTPEQYSRAFGERRRVLRDWLKFFQGYSVIVAPVSTRPPQVIDYDIATPENTASTIADMRMVVAINALGLPSAVVPVGMRDGLPQVVQVIGAPFEEMRCLAVAEAIEQRVQAFTPTHPA